MQGYDKWGQVYILRTSIYVKIGFSVNIKERIATIQSCCPHKLELIRLIENCTRLEERWMHNRFRDNHVHSEWFMFDEVMLTIKIPQRQAYIMRSAFNRLERKPPRPESVA